MTFSSLFTLTLWTSLSLSLSLSQTLSNAKTWNSVITFSIPLFSQRSLFYLTNTCCLIRIRIKNIYRALYKMLMSTWYWTQMDMWLMLHLGVNRRTVFPALILCSRVIWARTLAACSPPITDILAFGHMYRNRGLQTILSKVSQNNRSSLRLHGYIFFLTWAAYTLFALDIKVCPTRI